MMWENFQFAHPWVLWLALLLPLLLLGARRKLGGQGLRVTLPKPVTEHATVRRSHIGFSGWIGVALLCGIVALARPQLVDSEDIREFSGIEVMIALDVSRSMTARDLKLDNQAAKRLEVAKKITKEFIEQRPNDRIGMVAFSGQPFPVGPSTLDHQWLNDHIDDLRIGLVEDGTAIGSAISSAASRIDKRPAKSKVIVLVTDGANNVDNIDPIDAAKQAALLGIKVYTIAVGTEGEVQIEVPGPFGRPRLATMVSEFDPETLQEIAEVSGGAFYRAGSTKSFEDAFATINELEKTTQTKTTVFRTSELFHWPAAAALLALVIGTLIPPLDERAANLPRPRHLKTN
ncbi:VWA domain-containing protein [Sulfuriroseicoccus oceanibius]|uniref:VWA domain-containing protein n=1 Tax=Sulfuriroseicoccus oceanibius TaxID=2707525 RepID=A0A6B3LEA1_9BACT|nr:VWA domain-containing protein [Sulfuriroseicoccus oceanibius]QQL45173.1 VWA domain-containing protein [Sulfuriroseicoccus oceanibius]